MRKGRLSPLTEYREYRENAEREVLSYFVYCPLCFAENSISIEWGLGKDTIACLNCGAKWHINHGLTGFHWAKLIKDNSEGKGAEFLGMKIQPRFWRQMALDRRELTEATPKQVTKETPMSVAEEEGIQQEERIREEAIRTDEEKPWWKAPLKYFLHGISFSILYLILSVFLAVVFVVLAVLGAIIGVIIGFIVLFIFIGGLNSFLTDFIWSIPIKTEWKSLLGHGILLSVLLLIVSIPSIIISLAAPSLLIRIVLFIVYAFIDGFVAKKTAEYWEEEYEEID